MNARIMRKAQAGATLMEALVAMSISLVVTASMIGLMANSLSSTARIVKMSKLSDDLRVTMQALGWRMSLEGKARYLALQDDLASTAFWYQAEPHAEFPTLPDFEYLEVI